MSPRVRIGQRAAYTRGWEERKGKVGSGEPSCGNRVGKRRGIGNPGGEGGGRVTTFV
jgi:hypothetical protein